MEIPDHCLPRRAVPRPPTLAVANRVFSARATIMRAPAALLQLASRIRNVARRLWLLPETRPVVAADTMCLAVNVAELLFAVARPCVMSSRLYDETCGNSMLILQIITIVKVVLMSGLVSNCLQPRLAMAYSYAGLKLPLGNELKSVPTRGWAAASSVEVFQEVVRVRAYTKSLRDYLPPPAQRAHHTDRCVQCALRNCHYRSLGKARSTSWYFSH